MAPAVYSPAAYHTFANVEPTGCHTYKRTVATLYPAVDESIRVSIIVACLQ